MFSESDDDDYGGLPSGQGSPPAGFVRALPPVTGDSFMDFLSEVEVSDNLWMDTQPDRSEPTGNVC